VADIAMHKGQKVVHITMHIGDEVADTSMQQSQLEVTDTTIHINQQAANTTMDINELVVNATIIHIGEQAANTFKHTNEHVVNTLEDDKVAEMDIIAIEDPGFGNEDLDYGSKSEELPHLGKKNPVQHVL
jgi:hypothetical protein